MGRIMIKDRTNDNETENPESNSKHDTTIQVLRNKSILETDIMLFVCLQYICDAFRNISVTLLIIILIIAAICFLSQYFLRGMNNVHQQNIANW
jgi:F0F1-type ATP synthase assembly protein I